MNEEKLNELMPQLELKPFERNDDVRIVIEGQLIPRLKLGPGNHGTMSSYAPIVVEHTSDQGKKWYYIIKLAEEDECDFMHNLEADAPGVVISRYPRHWGDLIPEWAAGSTPFSGIKLDYLQNLDADDRGHLFWSQDDWDEEFEDQDAYDYGDGEEDTPEDKKERKKEFLKNMYYIADKLDESALMLDVYSHSGDAWSLAGCGIQCRWDTSHRAAVLLLEEYNTKKLKEKPDEVYKTINWFLKRMSGSTCIELDPTCVIDADTLKLDDDKMQDCYVVRLQSLVSDLGISSKENDVKKDILQVIDEHICGTGNFRIVKDVTYLPTNDIRI